MKNKFLFVLALLSVLTITGCKDKKSPTSTVLQAPQEVTVQSDGERSLIIFDEVKNADYYDIYINDVCVTVRSNGTGTIQFDASKIITLPQKYTIKVKAGGDRVFDSAFTEEYEYNHTSVLEAPVVSIDGTTLNWNKIANAEFYEVVVTSFNPTIETSHRFVSNKFNFANILANKGEYLFKVRAISESGEYVSSIYSNQVKYTHILTLETPHNLKVAYSETAGEYLLSFVSSENADGFTININGINYSLSQSEMSSFLYSNELKNIYMLKIETFAKSKGLQLDSSILTTISVKANTSNTYLQSSKFSNPISWQFISVLVTPRIDIKTSDTTCTINITSNNEGSKHLSGFAIYLNDKKYKTISSNITQIELPLTDEIRRATIRVQAISNNNNCYSSNLSDGKHIGVKPIINIKDLKYNQGVISWTGATEITSYYVEILNSSYRYAQVTTETSLNISSCCPCGEYWVKVTAIADGASQSSEMINVLHTTKLVTPTNVSITSNGYGTYLEFDEVEGAYGYLIYLNEIQVNSLFVGSPISLAPYIKEANAYSVQIKAVGVINKGIESSDMSTEQVIQSIKTLTAPKLSITKENDRYYLNIRTEENETEIMDGYEIWVNYQSIGDNLKSNKIDITSYFTNAGQYNFMAKAKAIDSAYIKDSNMASLTYNCIKQLDTVTDIKVTKLENESKYILTFKEQTLAAKYLVTIVKGDDENYNVQFELNHCVADISAHLVENGVYRVYVKALATEGSFYTDSATSGNPYRLTKGETLALPQNIEVAKSDGNSEVELTWNTVENSAGYQVYVYYENLGQNVLKKSIFVPQTLTPSIDIGSGDYLCLDKEGHYTIQIKALGDDKLYENSQTATMPYIYTMDTPKDFSRNTVFIAGQNYNYNVENAEQLKNLLWYHYLYNKDVWQYNTLEYNLKAYVSVNLDDMANEISESVATQVQEVSTNVEKMNIIARALLAQYPEIIKYIDGSLIQSFCLNPEINLYIFRYQNDLNEVKTETIETTNQVYKEKLDIVDAFDQRGSTYVFAIDNQESIDVTTTEQLFMALQYNKKPNFVGDCEVAKVVYENARFILRQICSDEMNEYEKTLQIYNFLTKRIAWNNVSTGSCDEPVTVSNSTSTLRGNLKDFYLEGVLYNTSSKNGMFTNLDDVIGNTADSEGLSKAFVVLCSIEGIDAIKVNGQKTIGLDENERPIIVNYSWNKVYIDIEEDGIDGKRWLVVDVTSAIKNTIGIRKSGVTTTYQVALHKYFLMTDAEFIKSTNIQATSLHKRLGDTTDYVASGTEVNYYTLQKYSCVYKSNELIKDATFTASKDTDIINVMAYASLKANKKHRVVVDIDAQVYMAGKGDASIDSIKSDINRLYSTASGMLGNEYRCNIATTVIDNRYIIIAFESENYSK